MWLDDLKEDFLYYTPQESVQFYGYVTYGIRAHVTTLGPIGVEIKVVRIQLLQIKKQYDKYHWRLCSCMLQQLYSYGEW